MTLITASLYLLTIAFLFGSAVFVYSRDPRSKVNGYYAVLALSLLGWVGTLFVFDTLPEGGTLLIVGRVNFAAVAVAVAAAYMLVAELAGYPPQRRIWLWLEAWAVAALSVATGLVDRAENIVAGQHVTTYGTLFVPYVVHIVAYVGVALVAAFTTRRGQPVAGRRQARLVGYGILATSIVAISTNVVLPYWFGDFALVNAGALSTVLLLAAVAYAVATTGLFNIRLILRATFVYGIIISLMLGAYEAAVKFLADLLPLGDTAERHLAATVIALVVNASTGDILRAWLNQVVDKRANGGQEPSR